VLSPMQGMVLTVKVKVGDKVKEGDTVVVTEAMKMQSDVHSPYTGTVKEIFAFNGEIVNKDDVLMVIE
jgi:pyruvate carboxylase subunit B